MDSLKYTIIDLNNHLFETLKALRDEKNPMPVERANAIAHIAQTIVNAGRLECYYLEIVGGTGTGFVPEADDDIGPQTLGSDRLRLRNDYRRPST